VSGLEDRVREAYLAAADLVREDAVLAQAPTRRAGSMRRVVSASGVRNRRVRRGWWIAPMAAAAAVAAIGVTVSVIVPHALSGRHAQSGQSARPQAHSRHAARVNPAAGSGLPEFALVSTGSGLQVVQTATGHVTGQVDMPAGQVFSQVAGDGSDRTFYLSAQQVNDQAPCHTYFYRLSLSADGQASALTLLPGSRKGGLPTGLAASADGRKLAFSVVHCATGAGKIPTTQAIGSIAVLDVTSGKITGHWTYTLGEDYPISMSLTPNGNLLAFAEYLPDGSAIVAKALRTDRPSGTVDQASRVVGLSSVSSLSVGPALYGCISVDRSGGRVRNQLGVFDLATGKRTAVLHTWTGDNGTCSLATNVVDGHLLASITTVGRRLSQGVAEFTIKVFAVDVSSGRLTPLVTVNNAPTNATIAGW